MQHSQLQHGQHSQLQHGHSHSHRQPLTPGSHRCRGPGGPRGLRTQESRCTEGLGWFGRRVFIVLRVVSIVFYIFNYFYIVWGIFGDLGGFWGILGDLGGILRYFRGFGMYFRGFLCILEECCVFCSIWRYFRRCEGNYSCKLVYFRIYLKYVWIFPTILEYMEYMDLNLDLDLNPHTHTPELHLRHCTSDIAPPNCTSDIAPPACQVRTCPFKKYSGGSGVTYREWGSFYIHNPGLSR